MDDAALVQRAAAQDIDAFAEVYERHAGAIYDFLWWVLQDRQEASQALYDTFLEAGSRLHELGDPGKLRPWLFAVASHQALRRHRRPTPEPPEPPPPRAAKGKAPDWAELVYVVRSVAADLTPKDRALLDLKYRQGLDGEDLADALGVRPDVAAEMVDRVGGKVERTLGDTVVAYLGRRDCPELRVLLGASEDDVGTRLDAKQRSVVEMHAEHCPTCGERRSKRIGARSLFGVTPAMAAPAAIQSHVLEDVELTAHRGRRWSGRRNGFPRPILVDTDRRVRVVAIAGTLVLLGAGAFLVTRGGRVPEQVASTGTTAARSAGSSVPFTTATTRPATTTTALVLDPSLASPSGPAGAGTGGGGSAGGTGASGSGASGSGGGGSGGGESTGTTPPATDPPTTDPPATEPPATSPPTSPPTTAPDTTGPTLGGLSVSPAVVRASGSRCTGGGATQATVTVQASDPSGIRSVRLTVAGPQTPQTAMTNSGGSTYTATIGPFETPLPPGVDFPGQVIVQATDDSPGGNTSSLTAPLTVRC